jgi:hypothetical protein
MGFAGLRVCFRSIRSKIPQFSTGWNRERHFLHRSTIFSEWYALYSFVQKPPDFLLCRQKMAPVHGGNPAMPKSYCSGCGRTFTSLSAFDLHRTGKFQRKMRRCLTEQGMQAIGMVQNEKGWWMRSTFKGALPWTVPEESHEGESA